MLGPNPAFAIVRFAVNPSVVRVRRLDSERDAERANEWANAKAGRCICYNCGDPTTERPRPFPFVRPKAARLRLYVSFVHITSRHENASVLQLAFLLPDMEVIISPHAGLLISFG